MTLRLDIVVPILERTPGVLDRLLRDLPTAWTSGNEGGDSWSPFDVVGHLIDGEETDWIPRARIILSVAHVRTFEPFDRFRHVELNKGRKLNELLDRFTSARRESLAALRGFDLNEVTLARTGLHPSLGEVTLAQLLATWVVHDLGHIAQITRVMAKQYAGEVGAWQEYLPVLHR